MGLGGAAALGRLSRCSVHTWVRLVDTGIRWQRLPPDHRPAPPCLSGNSGQTSASIITSCSGTVATAGDANASPADVGPAAPPAARPPLPRNSPAMKALKMQSKLRSQLP